jgi:hypothetical protein
LSNQLSREARLLLAEVRSASTPTDNDRRAVRGGLSTKIVATTAASAAATTLAGQAAAGGVGLIKLSLGAQFIAALIGGVALAGGTVAYSYRLPSYQKPPAAVSMSVARETKSATIPLTVASALPAASAESAASAADVAPPPREAPEPAPASRSRVDGSRSPIAESDAVTRSSLASNRRASNVESATADEPSLTDESRALTAVQRRLREHDGTSALRLLAEQDGKFVRGSLSEERAAARVYALCDAGQDAQARAAAREFVANWPRSPLAARVRATCVETSSSQSVTE